MLHIVLDSAGLVRRDGAQAQPRRAAATAAYVASEEVEGTDAAATWLMFLQDLSHLHRDNRDAAANILSLTEIRVP